MKLQCLIATALVLTIGSVILAQTPAEKTKPATTEKAAPPRLDYFGDPLPDGAIARLGTVRFRHSGPIYSFIFSPDGKTIASCSGSTTYLWDVATGREVWRVESDSTEKEYVSTLAFSRDGKLLACGGRRGEVARLVLRDAATGKQCRLLDDGNDWHIASVAFAPDGKTLASAALARGNRHSVRLRNVETGAELHCLEGATSVVAFSPDGKILATAGKAGGGPIRLWNPRTGQPVGSLPSNNEERSMGRIVFSADGKNLAVGSRSSKLVDSIVVWDIASAKEVRSFVHPSVYGTIFAFGGFALSPDGRLLAAPNSVNPFFLWDITTGKNMSRFPATLNRLEGVAFSPDGKLLACANGDDHAFHLWDPLTGQPVRPVDAPVIDVTSVVISSDGRTAASWTRYASLVRLWETATGKQSGAIKDRLPYAMAMVPGKSPRLLVYDGSWHTFYDIASKTQKWKRGEGAERIAFEVGGHLLFRGEWNDQEPATRKVRGLIEALVYDASLAQSADGKVLATLGEGRFVKGIIAAVKVWDVEGGGEHPAFRDKKISGTCVALTPDGRILAAHDNSDTVHFWDIATGRKLRTSHGRSGRPTALAFAPDGRTLAEGRTDGTIRLLETATGGERRILTGHHGQINSLAWSADSRILISASHDTTALVWDVTGFHSDQPSSKKLSPAELESLWSDLAGPTTSRTHRAVWMLASSPEQAIPFLRERVRPAPAVDPEVIDRLLADLNSAQFTVRDKASRELRKLGESAESATRQVLATKPGAEVRGRLESLLEALSEWSSEDLRALRALESLEHMDTPDGRKLLEALSKGAPDARLTREADASLKNLIRQHVALGKAAALDR